MAKSQAVAAGELRRLGLAAGELIDHLALGQLDVADRDRKVQLLRFDLQRHLTEADFTHEGMAVRVAALGRISHGEQKTLVTARQVLQAGSAVGRKTQRLARQVGRCRITGRQRLALDQALLIQQLDHTRRTFMLMLIAAVRAAGGHRRAVGEQAEVEQALGVVKGRTQHLAARQVFESGRDTPLQHHARGVQRARAAQAGQGGAVSAQQKNRLHQVAGGLLDCQCGQFRVVDRAFGHDPVDRQPELLADLRHAEFGQRGVAPALAIQQRMAVEDGGFSALDGNVHAQVSLGVVIRVLRGKPTRSSALARKQSTPHGKLAWLSAHCAKNAAGKPLTLKRV